MAHSLEVRVPFLDHVLLEFAARIPPEYKLRRMERKHVLKRAVRDLLPKSFFHRRKMGFSVPLARWLRGPLRRRVHEAMHGERLADSGYFNAGALRRLAAQHAAGSHDHSAPLWSLLMFEAFLRSADLAAPVPQLRSA